MKILKIFCLSLMLVLCLELCGCRVRIRDIQAGPAAGQGSVPEVSSSGGTEEVQNADTEENGGEPGEKTRENPQSSRKEYDENAAAEIIAGTDRTVNAEGEGPGSYLPGEQADVSVSKLNETAEETATRTVPAEEASDMGVSEDGQAADSALTYYSVLLQDRMGSLFECQRQYVYWETAEDHRTVYKTSPEHILILDAGCYDVSSRLLEENLLVDDGWIARKNPGVIVKITDSSILGAGTAAAGKAKALYNALLARDGWQSIDAVQNRRVLLLSEQLLQSQPMRTAAMLLIAMTANPDLFSDTDPDRALEDLFLESSGSLPNGLYYYSGHE